MPASGNVGLAFGLVAASGMATTLGACIVFCADVAKPRLLAASLGFAAGVMLYVSFAEIFLRKSVTAFVNAGQTANEAYRYSTLGFFCGFLIIAVLDKIVHALVDCAMVRQKEVDLPNSQSEAVLLDNEAGTEAGPTTAPGVVTADKATRSERVASQDVEAQEEAEEEEQGEEPSGSCQHTPSSPCGSPKAAAAAIAQGPSTSREPPPIIEILKADPHHAFNLKKMGLLTALAIFIHNFPEGLATFVGALADTKLGVGLAVAIAIHNIPEGICVAMPIYYATGSKLKGFMWALLSGMSEPVGALVGWAVLYGDTSLSFAIVFAVVAGMMVFISLKELLPTALKYDPHDTVATSCVVLGMVVMAGSLLLFTI